MTFSENWNPGEAPVPYGMTPGVRQVLPGINDRDPRPLEQRYGLGNQVPPSIGGKWIRPDDVNLDAPSQVKPDDVTLDEEPGPAPPLPGRPMLSKPAPEAPRGPATGWRIKDAKGNVVATVPADPDTGKAYQQLQVQNIGDSLFKQAVSPEEKEAATRATAFGLSLVGSMSNEKIQAAIVHRYDSDTGNSLKRDLQAMRTRNRGGGGAAPAPGGISKQDKVVEGVDKDASGVMEGVIKDSEAQAKLSALNAYEQDLQDAEAQMSDPNPMAQRAAVANYMKMLTGKQSTDIERRQILGANGIIDKIKNDLQLWNPNDASMTKAFRQSFIRNIATLRAAVAAQKKKLAQATADALSHHPFLKKHGDAVAAGNYGKGRISGEYDDKQAAPDDLLNPK
jgi:hypothetical protein